MATLGIDPGSSNFTVSLYDGTSATVSKIDLRAVLIGGVWYARPVTAGNVGRVVERFIDDNAEMFAERVHQVGIEKQWKEPWIKMTKEFTKQLTARYPHLIVRLVDPKLPRAHFGTSVPGGYDKHPERKERSIEFLSQLAGKEDRTRFERIFGTKLDDPVEATLIAIYTHRVPAAPKELPKRARKRMPDRVTKGMVPYRGARVKVRGMTAARGWH